LNDVLAVVGIGVIIVGAWVAFVVIDGRRSAAKVRGRKDGPSVLTNATSTYNLGAGRGHSWWWWRSVRRK
jgi:hypothetical protein